LILSVHGCELQSPVAEDGGVEEKGGRGGSRVRRMVIGVEIHGIISHGRRLTEREQDDEKYKVGGGIEYKREESKGADRAPFARSTGQMRSLSIFICMFLYFNSLFISIY
jgi:hypothetical protein